VRRVQAEFVPVALKAAQVNGPPAGEEGRLYAEIGRSKPAPQGICSVNSAGKVLAWALSFDGDPSVPAFLDYVLKRYEAYPGGEKPVSAERFMRYPSGKMEDVGDGGALAVPEKHGKEDRCLGARSAAEGTLLGRATGRTYKDGKPFGDPQRQEHYVEDTFEVSVEIQEAVVQAARKAEGQRFRLPEPFGRSLVASAFLGMLDVNPLGSPGGRNDSKEWEFWGRREGDRITFEGTSTASGGQDKVGSDTDGRRWTHEVRLAWKGLIETRGLRATRLLATASGHEKLTWANNRMIRAGESDVAHLPAGRPIAFDGDVRYGFEARPAAPSEIGPDPAAGPAGTLPGKMRALGPALKAYAQSGGDLQALQPDLEKLQRLLENQDVQAAEKRIDALLERLRQR
jgi:hypothetical protein